MQPLRKGTISLLISVLRIAKGFKFYTHIPRADDHNWFASLCMSAICINWSQSQSGSEPEEILSFHFHKITINYQHIGWCVCLSVQASPSDTSRVLFSSPNLVRPRLFISLLQSKYKIYRWLHCPVRCAPNRDPTKERSVSHFLLVFPVDRLSELCDYSYQTNQRRR